MGFIVLQILLYGIYPSLEVGLVAWQRRGLLRKAGYVAKHRHNNLFFNSPIYLSDFGGVAKLAKGEDWSLWPKSTALLIEVCEKSWRFITRTTFCTR